VPFGKVVVSACNDDQSNAHTSLLQISGWFCLVLCLQKELVANCGLNMTCMVCSALALGSSKEQICVLEAASNANLKAVSEQVRQILEEAAHMADPLTGGSCLYGRFGLEP